MGQVLKREAGLTRKLAHDRRRAKQRARRGTVLPMKGSNGLPDFTPYVASMNIVTEGRYLEIGAGYPIRNWH